MPHLRHTRQIELDDADGAVGAPDVRLQRVEPAVSIGSAVAHDLDQEASDAAGGPDLRALVAAVRAPVIRNGLVLVGLMASLAVAVGDVRVGLVGALIPAAVVPIRFIDRHVTFSFGAGFVGFRADMGWPHGVQEDDDVHWNWRPRPVNHPAEHRS